MLTFLRQRWFLISLVVLITSGLTIGANLSADGARSLSDYVKPRWITAIVLFLMAFSLDSRHLRNSFRTPGPVVWASLVNYGFIPLLAWSLMLVQRVDDFRYGLMIAASVPCTLAAASVWTRKAGGNDAVSLLVTLVTNTACFIVTPFWINLTTSSGVELELGYMVYRLLQAVLIPTLLGQFLRQFRGPASIATKYKTPIGVAAQGFILTLVFTAACKAGTHLTGDVASPDVTAVIVVWASCVAVHLAAMYVGMTGARLFGFRLADRAAVAFASSQKTLPIGILLATDPEIFGGKGVPFAVFPMLMYHASQLFIDTVIADRLAAQAKLADAALEAEAG